MVARRRGDTWRARRGAVSVTTMDEPDANRPVVSASTPRIQQLLEDNFSLSDRLGQVNRRVENLVRTVASDDESVIGGVDGLQRTATLYLKPGVKHQHTPEQLASIITETFRDAGQLAAEAVAEARAEAFGVAIHDREQEAGD